MPQGQGRGYRDAGLLDTSHTIPQQLAVTQMLPAVGHPTVRMAHRSLGSSTPSLRTCPFPTRRRRQGVDEIHLAVGAVDQQLAALRRSCEASDPKRPSGTHGGASHQHAIPAGVGPAGTAGAVHSAAQRGQPLLRRAMRARRGSRRSAARAVQRSRDPRCCRQLRGARPFTRAQQACCPETEGLIRHVAFAQVPEFYDRIACECASA